MAAINPEPNRLPGTTQPINNNPPVPYVRKRGAETVIFDNATFPVPLKDEEEDLKTLDHTSLANTFIDKWKIGRGGFAVVYKATATFADGVEVAAAFKAEARSKSAHAANVSNIRYESSILYKLTGKGHTAHFPSLFATGEKPHFDYMVMSLLGPNLFEILALVPNEALDISSWTRVMYQVLTAIKGLHDIGIIHLDCKPANFVFGHKDDDLRQIFHLIDFGLSKKFGTKEKPSDKIIYKEEKKGCQFIGTITHCSLFAYSRDTPKTITTSKVGKKFRDKIVAKVISKEKVGPVKGKVAKKKVGQGLFGERASDIERRNQKFMTNQGPNKVIQKTLMNDNKKLQAQLDKMKKFTAGLDDDCTQED
uniref:Protein kinase domain-containing protein n=1 Tax=Rhabditophanes sp. KR3021 TaxID=114890 RepID=A0AC35TU80_9BILA